MSSNFIFGKSLWKCCLLIWYACAWTLRIDVRACIESSDANNKTINHPPLSFKSSLWIRFCSFFSVDVVVVVILSEAYPKFNSSSYHVPCTHHIRSFVRSFCFCIVQFSSMLKSVMGVSVSAYSLHAHTHHALFSRYTEFAILFFVCECAFIELAWRVYEALELELSVVFYWCVIINVYHR